MEERRFRNHYSVVFERMGAFIVLIVVALANNLKNFSELIESLKDVGREGFKMGGMISMIGILLIIILVGAVMIGVNSMIWSKTWITITESTIIMERNTMNRVKNTIGMKNVSNVNLEQNLWEKILGTAKVKLDTNSLSTANSTDVKIVLRKKEAQEIRALILKQVNIAQGKQAEYEVPVNNSESKMADVEKVSQEADVYDIKATGKDIFLNGICSISLVSLWILIGCIIGVGTAITSFNNILSGGMAAILGNLVVVLGIIVTCLRNLFGGFITYHDFKAGRREDKLYVHYGLLRTFDFVIPVSKINGVVIRQTFIGRIMKKYMVKVINVGMGDEDEEAGSFIILACDRSQLQEYLKQLLPEFAEIPIDEIKRQPRAIIWNKIIKTLCYSAMLVSALVIADIYIPYVQSWMCIIGAIVVITFGIILAILDYYTAGTYFDQKQILTANGCFRRDVTVMRYENIQYFRLKTNILLKYLGMERGTAYLLAEAGSQEQPIAACQQAELEPYLERYGNEL